MGFFNSSITPAVSPKSNPFLLQGESTIQSFTLLFDELILTDRRVIFTDGNAIGSKRKTVSLAYSKITAIEIEKNLAVAHEITIISGSKEWSFKAHNPKEAPLIYNMLAEKIF